MTKLLKVLTVDDEPLARRIIRRQLKDEKRIRSIIEAKDGDEAFELIRQYEPELIYLDIQMPGCNGFELLEKLREIKLDFQPIVIFVTAFDEFAVKAFEFHALDYLLKPFDQNRFKESFELAVKQIFAEDQSDYQQKLLKLINDLKPQDQTREWVSIKKGDKISLFGIEKIMWIEAQGNYAMIQLTETKNLVREKMDDLESKLDPSKFIRIHRSAIINTAFIKEIEDWGKGDYKVVMSNGKIFNVSKTYRTKLDFFFNVKVL